MRIKRVTCDVLKATSAAAASCETAQDNALVEIESASGLVGWGEVESNPWVIKALIEAPGTNTFNQPLAHWLAGREFTHPMEAWDFLYEKTLVTGRRGAGICALGAVDMALWDLLGKICGQPVWRLLAGDHAPVRRAGEPPVVTPYASLLPVGSTLAEYRDSMLDKAMWAQQAGFRAVKIEIMIRGPFAMNGLTATNRDMVELVRLARAALGPEMVLMVDVGYCWSDANEAASVLRQMEAFNLFFIETPLRSDDMAGHARLAELTSIPIAAGELLQTRFEFEELMDRGKVRVVQPDVGRVGGISEAMRVVALARERGLLVVPHCWKTGLSIAATAHVAAMSPNCPFIEFLPAEVSESPLRRELLEIELELSAGRIELPDRPGLGVELNEAVRRRFRVDAPSSAIHQSEELV